MDRRKQIHLERPLHIGDAINRTLELVEKIQTGVVGIPSGYPSIDRITQGWGEGELIVIGARPCVGKTALALGMARNAAVEFGVPTAYCSLESSAVELTERLIVAESGLTMEQLEGRKMMKEGDWQQMEMSLAKLAKAPLYIDETPSKTPRDYRLGAFQAQADELVKEKNVRLVFVDNLQEICPGWTRYTPECLAEECRKNLRYLKEMARTSGLSIIVLTWIVRPDLWHGPGPTLLDLGDYCPCADEYADKILLLDRPRFFDINEDGTEPFQVRVVQNRNGRVGQAELVFDKDRIIVQ